MISLSIQPADVAKNDPPSRPSVADIAKLEDELKQWMSRGGIIGPNDKLADYGIKLPSGTRVGGEFSDEEMAAYLDAARKLDTMKRAQRLAPVMESMTSEKKAPTDVTVVRVVPLARKSAKAPIALTPSAERE